MFRILTISMMSLTLIVLLAGNGRAQVDQLERERSSLDAESLRLKKDEGNLTSLRSSLDSDARILKSLEEQLDHKAEAIKSSQQPLLDDITKLKDQEKEQERESSAIDQLQSDVGRESAAIEAQRGKSRTNPEVERFNQRVRTYNERLTVLKRRIEAYNARVRQQEAIRAAINARITTARQQILDHSVSEKAKNRLVDQYESKRNEINVAANRLKDASSDFQTRVNAFNAKVKAVPASERDLNLKRFGYDEAATKTAGKPSPTSASQELKNARDQARRDEAEKKRIEKSVGK